MGGKYTRNTEAIDVYIRRTGTKFDDTNLQDAILELANDDAAASTHASATDNPHSVTAAQVGAYTTGEVDLIFADYYTSVQVDTLLTSYYTSAQVDAIFVDYYTSAQVDSLLAGKADTSHTHVIADVTGLQTALDGKATAAQGALADTALQDITAESIGDLSDVDITGVADGEVLTWVAANSRFEPGAGGGGGAVSSVFTRTGAVVAAASDYDADQIDYDNATSGLTATDVQAALDEIVAGGGGGGTVTTSMPFSGARRRPSAAKTGLNFSAGDAPLTEAQWDTSDYDATSSGGTYWSDAKDGFVVPASGKYLVTATTKFDSSTVNPVMVLRHYNSADVEQAETIAGNSTFASGSSAGTISAVFEMAAGDYTQLNIFCSDSSINLAAESHYSITAVSGSELDITTTNTVTSAMPFSGARRYVASAKTGINYSVTSQPLTETQLDTSAYDTDSWWSDADDGFVVPSGVTKVRVGCNVSINNITSTDALVRVLKNGNDFLSDRGDASSNNFFAVSLSGEIEVTAGDIFKVVIFVASDTSVNLEADDTNFWIEAAEGSILNITAAVDGVVWSEDTAETWNVSSQYLEIDLPTEHKDIEIELNGIYFGSSIAAGSFSAQVSTDDKSTWVTAGSKYAWALSGFGAVGAEINNTSPGSNNFFWGSLSAGIASVGAGIVGTFKIRRLGTDLGITFLFGQEDQFYTGYAYTVALGTDATNIRFYIGSNNWASKATMGDDAVKILTK